MLTSSSAHRVLITTASLFLINGATASAQEKTDGMTFKPLPALPLALAPTTEDITPKVVKSETADDYFEQESVTPDDQGGDHAANPDIFDATRDARADVDQALSAAKSARKYTLVVMGGNWCHDSDALTGHFLTPKFQTMFDKHYEVVYVDVGMKDKNLDVARSFGLDGIVGTPTVAIVSYRSGDVLNLDSAVTWRNSAVMDGDDVLRYFTDFAVEARKARL